MRGMGGSLTLKDLGYHFDQNGEFRRISDNGRFIFTNQEDYEKLGCAMTNELYSILENQCGLVRIDVTVGVEDEHNNLRNYRSFVYASRGFRDKSTVVLIIHGSGAVRPGQWSRRLILNEGLNVGSQVPYIQRAHDNDWGVILCNTNTSEEFCGYPQQHLRAVYDQLLSGTTSIQRVLVVAHSRGGQDFVLAFPHFKNDDRIVAVCLTDSINFEMPHCLTEEANSKGPVFINWIANSDIRQTCGSDGDMVDVFSRVHQIYAGTTEHERTSYSALNSVFYVLENLKSPSDLPELLPTAAKLTSGEV
ncbi:hypothetical protein KIN20_027482 [Parelaphostrongylus tenuis]|uniref:Arb2 domain-containing protein n=1 Tax=Parelaphostrongylus tenuis TaxID=148309 RepID=A0AAD5WE54_PARTN|nr:hypothetical protein KIN20_027482 [Parelaphostrongylus tenuis]